ncbi:hypothetical protein BBK36DRAFT_1168041 [Trichoderma citrinoviride]|uniref:Uncharacterized protein n=1 Tax=Trichoderma citrinoviride TaxID=58853 RepID=A0A2T4BEN1_9HYPO|nr:hypothetical protein BBK36DRAFT_1168041 [Trichoderma citrinoviride]PTB67659.1 hypothetical protein BBK36DRAFT_1168041 [Trichoderma citrinoviride]
MGGSAFAQGQNPLSTPRMPKEVYEATKSRCEKILLGLYSCVESPVEGPAKKDYGDIDFLVASPKSDAAKGSLAIPTIAQALGAERKIVAGGAEPAANLAIPWPEDESDDDGKEKTKTDKEDKEEPARKYIQVDVRVCESEEKLRWMLFKHGHGDFWNVMGSIIRPYGLTVDETAMWLRVPEIEEHNRKRARIFLSSDPAKVMDFLDMRMEGYWDKAFSSMEELYDYIATCRLMYVDPTPTEPEESKLKANDRRRMNYRPVFRKWIDEFIPECRRLGKFSEKRFTREQITEEAFAAFGVEEEFNTRRDKFLAEKQKEYIWSTSIKGGVPEPKSRDRFDILYRSCLVKALKKIILEDDTSYGIVPVKNLKKADGMYDLERVEDFISKNQESVGKAAIAQHYGAYDEHMRRKECQKECEEGQPPRKKVCSV